MVVGSSLEDIEDAGGIVEMCRKQMENALPIAVRTMIELAQSGEKENVRLAAAAEIMERGGMPKKTEIVHKVDPKQHEAADLAALELVTALAKNKGGAPEPKTMAIETAIILDGDEISEPPLAAPDMYPDILEVESVEVADIEIPIDL
jgi:hypothetical protein